MLPDNTASPTVTSEGSDITTFGFVTDICVLASTRSPCYRKHPVNFVSYKSQVTAFPKLLLPNHIIEVLMKSQY